MTSPRNSKIMPGHVAIYVVKAFSRVQAPLGEKRNTNAFAHV